MSCIHIEYLFFLRLGEGKIPLVGYSVCLGMKKKHIDMKLTRLIHILLIRLEIQCRYINVRVYILSAVRYSYQPGCLSPTTLSPWRWHVETCCSITSCDIQTLRALLVILLLIGTPLQMCRDHRNIPWFNLLKPNDIYTCRTAALTSRRYILNIYSTNIHTEYFKHAA